MLSSYPTSISTDQELLQRHQELSCQQAGDAGNANHAPQAKHAQQAKRALQAKRAQQALTNRHAQAVRARLEHKLLIAAAIELLETYITAISAARACQ